jgi:hypothetical protein
MGLLHKEYGIISEFSAIKDLPWEEGRKPLCVRVDELEQKMHYLRTELDDFERGLQVTLMFRSIQLLAFQGES